MTTNPTVHIDGWFRDSPDDDLFFHQRGRPTEPSERVALHLDRSTGEVWADMYFTDGGMDTRETVFTRIPSTTVAGAVEILEQLTPALQRVLDAVDLSEYGDSWNPILEEDPEYQEAQDAKRGLEVQLGRLTEGVELPSYVDPLTSAFAEGWNDYITPETTDEELGEFAEAMSEPQDTQAILVGDALEYLEGIREEKREEAAREAAEEAEG